MRCCVLPLALCHHLPHGPVGPLEVVRKIILLMMVLCTRRCTIQKKYIVRLSDEELAELHTVIKRLKGTSQKVRRAQILLKADANGPNWTDARIAEAFLCRIQTVEFIRQRLV